MFPRLFLICFVLAFVYFYSLTESGYGGTQNQNKSQPNEQPVKEHGEYSKHDDRQLNDNHNTEEVEKPGTDDAAQFALSIAKALYNVNQAKAEAIEANQPMLTQSLLKMEERFEFPSRIACLLSQSFSDVNMEQCVERMVLEASKRLEDEVRIEFLAKADAMADKKKEKFAEMTVATDVENSVAVLRQKVTLMARLAEEVKDEIEGVAKDLEQHLQEKVTKIKKEVTEHHFALQQEIADQEAVELEETISKAIQKMEEAKEEAIQAMGQCGRHGSRSIETLGRRSASRVSRKGRCDCE